ncbi:MAG: DNA polymerase/3'-5' exonuclease PolX [Gemmatimonadaceae bacterium]
MDPRTASHVLSQIGDLLELQGAQRFKAKAYAVASHAILSVQTDDLCPLYRSGALSDVKGLGPATLGVIGELCADGQSSYLERLRAVTPEGLIDLMRVPGLGTAKIHRLHQELGITSVEDLEAAARDGRLAALPRLGEKTAQKILKGLEYLRATGDYVLYPRGRAEGEQLAAMVRQHPDIQRVEIAGALRRRREIVRDLVLVASCRAIPAAVADDFARMAGVRDAAGIGSGTVSITFVDGIRMKLRCVEPPQFGVALWRATGSEEHERGVRQHAESRGMTISEEVLRDADGMTLPTDEEPDLYRALGLAYVEPELREGLGEVEAAVAGRLPTLIRDRDLRGVLHCHSDYSDGKATIAQMASAAQARGWDYIGISDHSQSAFYAGGLPPERVLAQHEEIDRVNETFARDGFRVLKGIEADILLDGRIDYEPELLDRFDYVIGSVHSRFGLGETAMTERVLAALDSRHLTILGHPTGRLLLSREPYAIDMDAVIDKASERSIAIELNADPHRLDLDWRLCRVAKERGVTIEIGPDAHSTNSLDNTEFGIGIARKGWLEAGDVLNTREADEVVRGARARRNGEER